MADTITQNKLIIVLTAVLLAVVAASTLILFLLPSDESGPTTQISDTDSGVEITPTEQAVTTTEGFRLEVLGRQAYQLLNKQLVREGALPVKPPATVGKANPFL